VCKSLQFDIRVLVLVNKKNNLAGEKKAGNAVMVRVSCCGFFVSLLAGFFLKLLPVISTPSVVCSSVYLFQCPLLRGFFVNFISNSNLSCFSTAFHSLLS
jgi:hypothetical protein